MELRGSQFSPGLVVTTPGGLDYLKMPMQAMQLGPNGELIPTSITAPIPTTGTNIAIMEPLSIPSTTVVTPNTVVMNQNTQSQSGSRQTIWYIPSQQAQNEAQPGKDEQTPKASSRGENSESKEAKSANVFRVQPGEASTLNLTDLEDTPAKENPAHDRPEMAVVKVRAETAHYCATCDKDFHNDFNLKRHNRDFHGSGATTIYHCDICKKNFQNKFNLRRHKTAVHGDDEGTYFCEICVKDFHYRDNLKRHMKEVHKQNLGSPVAQDEKPSNTRPFTCSICNKDLQNNYNLKRHRMAVHKETKLLYGCDECEKDFTTIASYKRHKNMVHGQGKQAFHCDQCDKDFASKDGLKRHTQAIHELAEGRFECDVCKKRFLRKENVVKHRKTHELNFSTDELQPTKFKLL